MADSYKYERYADFEDGKVLYAEGLHYLETYLEKCLNISDSGASVTGDLNLITEPGVYKIVEDNISGLINGPGDNLKNGSKLIVLNHYTSNCKIQFLCEAGTNAIYWRTYENTSNSWLSWKIIPRNISDLGVNVGVDVLNQLTEGQTPAELAAALEKKLDKTAQAASAKKVANALTIGTQKYDGSSAVKITAADLGLGNAIKFIGVIDAEDDLPDSANNGDVVLWKEKEYIYSNGKWVLFGDEGSYALKTLEITAGGGLLGGGKLERNIEFSHYLPDSSNTDANRDIPKTAFYNQFITQINRDSYGHVTGVVTTKPQNPTLNANENAQLILTNPSTGTAASTISISGGGIINVTGDADNNKLLISANVAAAGGNNIGKVGEPSVTSETVNGVTTFYFNYLKGEKGDPGDMTEVISIPEQADLNDYKTPGFYCCTTSETAKTLANYPDLPYRAFSLVVLKTAGGGGITQELKSYLVSAPHRFFRNYYDNNWSDWYEEYTTYNKPSLSNDTIISIPYGGTGATTTKAAQYNLLNDMNSNKDNDISDDSAIIFKYNTSASSTANGAIFSKPATTLKKYILDKVTSTELNYLSGATSNVQTQLNTKAAESDVKTLALTPIAITTQGEDLNNYTTEGFYTCGASETAKTLLNCPTEYAFGLTVIKTTGSTGRQQRLTVYLKTQPRTYFRNCYEGEWSEWYKEYSTFDKPSLTDCTGMLAVEKGGTNATTAQAAQYNLLKDMKTSEIDITDDSAIVFKYSTTNANTTNGAIFSKPATILKKYILGNVTSAELGYLSGVTSNIQTQLDKRLNLHSTGSALKQDDDLNDYITPGVYTAVLATAQTVKNTPCKVGFKLVVIQGYSSNYISQFVFRGNANQWWYRSYSYVNEPVWTDWHSYLPTSGGTLTDNLTIDKEYVYLYLANGKGERVGAFYGSPTEHKPYILSYPSDNSGYYEGYGFPAAATGLTANKWYNILTTKNKVTVAQGGTGHDFSDIPANAIIRNSGNNTGLWYTATASGALYATAANEPVKFGMLPIAQGGTGATDKATALSNLGAAAASHNHDAGNITTGKIAAARLPTASTTATGIVKIGSNISVSSGTISITKANVTAALGYDIVYTDSNTTTAPTGSPGTIWLKGTGEYA